MYRFNWGMIFGEDSHGLKVNSYIKSTSQDAKPLPGTARQLVKMSPAEIPDGTYLISFQIPAKYTELGDEDTGDTLKHFASMYLKAHGIEIATSAEKPGPFYVELRVKTPEDFLRGTRLLQDCFDGNLGFTHEQMRAAREQGRPNDLPELPEFDAKPAFDLLADTRKKQVRVAEKPAEPDKPWKTDARHAMLHRVFGPNIDRLAEDKQRALFDSLYQEALDNATRISHEYSVTLPKLLNGGDTALRAQFVEVYMETRRGESPGEFVMPQRATPALRLAFKSFFNEHKVSLSTDIRPAQKPGAPHKPDYTSGVRSARDSDTGYDKF